MPNDSVPIWAFSAVLIIFNGLLGLMIMRLWKSVDDNTSAVNGLSVEMPQTYATKTDAERHRLEDHDSFTAHGNSIQGLRDRMHAMDLRLTAIDGDIRSARAGLRDAAG